MWSRQRTAGSQLRKQEALNTEIAKFWPRPLIRPLIRPPADCADLSLSLSHGKCFDGPEAAGLSCEKEFFLRLISATQIQGLPCQRHWRGFVVFHSVNYSFLATSICLLDVGANRCECERLGVQRPGALPFCIRRYPFSLYTNQLYPSHLLLRSAI